MSSRVLQRPFTEDYIRRFYPQAQGPAMAPTTAAPVVTGVVHQPAFALWYEGLPPLQRAAATLLAFGSLMVAITAIGHWAARGPLSD